MNKNEFLLAYQYINHNRSAKDVAYFQRQGCARREIERMHDARSLRLILDDINGDGGEIETQH